MVYYINGHKPGEEKDTLKKISSSGRAVIFISCCNCFLQFRNRSIFPVDIIDDLAPDTTYCLKVQATCPVDSKEGLFSPIRCIKTTRKGTE